MIYRVRYPEDILAVYDLFTYPAGEAQVRIRDSEFAKIAQCNELEVVARIKNGDVMDLALLTDAILGLQHFDTTLLVLPYLPYSRADRRFVIGDCAGLQVFAGCINALGYDEVRTVDVHSVQARNHFLNFVNIDATPMIEKAIADIGRDNLTILLPDEGAGRYNLDRFNLPILRCEKKRDAGTGKLSGFVVPNITTRKALIVDDICDGGGTFIGIADSLNRRSVEELYLYVTHGIFSKGMDNLARHFRQVYCSSTWTSADWSILQKKL